jgi:hypothetical protein
VTPTLSDSVDFSEPLLRDFDHLPDALQDVRVKDHPERSAVSRDRRAQLLCFVHRAPTSICGGSSFYEVN